MAEYKDVSSLEVVAYKGGNKDFDDGVQFILEKLDSIPTADVVEVMRGEWLPDYETFVDEWERESEPIQTGWVCSLCGRQEWNKEPYCHCGAKMDGNACNKYEEWETTDVTKEWDKIQRFGHFHNNPNCKFFYSDEDPNGHDYCPHCGAKMNRR